MKDRDISQAQFDARCREYGFKAVGFLGYYDVGDGLHVSTLNAGMRRRSQLAYLIQERDRWRKKAEEEKKRKINA